MKPLSPILREGRASMDVLRKIAGAGYVLSTVTTLSSLTLPTTDAAHRPAIFALSATYVLLAAVLLLGRSLPAWAVKVLGIGGGVVFTSLSIALLTPLGVTPMYYIYPAMTSGYFGTRRDAGAQIVLMAVTSAVALAVAETTEPRIGVWLGALSISAAVTGGTVLVAEQVDGLMARLHDVAASDGLTGLLNRRAFTEAAGEALAAAAGAGAAVVLFDLDHFKRVNDEHGHAGGDDALRRFGRILGEASEGRLVGRYGGEEFAALLPGADAEAARRWAQDVSDRFARETEAEGRPLTTSAGVAGATPPLPAFDALMLAADTALYGAKAAGRRRVVVAGDALPPLSHAA